MKYNEKYDRWVTTGGLVYRYDSKQDKLVLCKLSDNGRGYKYLVSTSRVYVHRLVYETFKGPIPDGMEIDHEDTHKDNNSIDNLLLVDRKGNMNNPLTKNKLSKVMKGHKISEEAKQKMSLVRKGKVSHKLNRSFSEFGKKYIEHYGYSKSKNRKQYDREHTYYKAHNNTCSWEIENANT